MNQYTSKEIEVLEGLEPVRKRPGMYIGSTGPEGLHHLIWEVVDNSIDEALAGYAKNIIIRLLPDNFVEVEDDGRGIPVDIHEKTKKTALETVMTYLHAGGKFSNQVYKVSGGLHGVGVSVVNALSEKLIAIVCRDGYIWQQEYSEGKPLGPVKKIGKTQKTGTIVRFKPDKKIFKNIEFDWGKIISHIREQAFLTSGIKFFVYDERKNKKAYSFYFENGIKSFIHYLTFSKKLIHEEIFYFMEKEEDSLVEVAIAYTDGSETIEYAFTNNIKNKEGGTHLTGLRTGLTKSINDFAREKGFLKEKDENFTGDDVREGLIALVSVKIPNPQFEGQTKSKLGNPEVRALVESLVQKRFKEFLEINQTDAKLIINKILLTAKARQAAKTAKEAVLRKGAYTSFGLPGKLADCSTKRKEEAEIFIVEGDSAGGSAKQGRDRKFQAVLPLRGKILNVEKSSLDKILKSEEIKNLIIALGTGFGKDFNLNGLRYSKIIIATDADSDGNHIRTLLLTLFYRYMRPLIEQGFVYIAQPPLYKIQVGKEIYYAYSDNEKEKIIADLTQTKQRTSQRSETQTEVKSIKIDVQRYKGLGEMNPEELWETTLNPEKRILKKVTIKEAEEAEKLFSILMGEEIEPRKKFIEFHAKQVQNLDI